MPHLRGYARVSTADQDPQLQLDALNAAGCAQVRTDHASGAREDRPELTRLLGELLAGDTLVVWRLDRLGRSLRHLVEVVGDLEARGIHLRSLTESIDTSTASGKLVFGVFASLAEFERDLIRERTQAGLAAARARGRHGGRPRALSPTQVDLARQMRDSGDHTVAAIAEALGVGRSTIYRALG